MWAANWYRGTGTTSEGTRVYAVREPLFGCVTKTRIAGRIQKIPPISGCVAKNHQVLGTISKLKIDGVLVAHPSLDGTTHGSS